MIESFSDGQVEAFSRDGFRIVEEVPGHVERVQVPARPGSKSCRRSTEQNSTPAKLTTVVGRDSAGR
jgi:hypothetical protein